eukprot:3191116-Pleurochrysis_carterae.AAC.1
MSNSTCLLMVTRQLCSCTCIPWPEEESKKLRSIREKKSVLITSLLPTGELRPTADTVSCVMLATVKSLGSRHVLWGWCKLVTAAANTCRLYSGAANA